MKIGILGCGQLARMITLAAYPLGIKTLALETDSSRKGNGVSPIFYADAKDHKKLAEFASLVDVITFETENIENEIMHALGDKAFIAPNSNIVTIAQDRLQEKALFNDLGIKTANYKAIYSLSDLESSVDELGLPAILKTTRFGYDGKGQYLIREKHQCQAAFDELGSQALILESFVNFDYEVSMVCARSRSGEIVFYPLTQNEHRDGILRISKVLNNAGAVSVGNELPTYESLNELQGIAQTYATSVLNHLNYIGVLTIEFFVSGNELIANEMAPRVHNSGHWTIDGAHTSQFENHVRAICDLPLGSCQAKGYAAMVNCIGEMPKLQAVLEIDFAHYHAYGKAPRPGRKLGHININTPSHDELENTLIKVKNIIRS